MLCVSVSDEPVLEHIKDLCADEKGDVVDADSYQDFIPSTVERLVVVAVDLDDISVVSNDQ